MKNANLTAYLQAYDQGEEMECVEMGGISMDYEQALLTLAIEMMRELQYLAVPEDIKDFLKLGEKATDKAVNRLSDKYGFSGAQVGAARNLSAVFWKQGPQVGLDKMKKDDPTRILKIQKKDDELVITKSELTNY
jgi:hypothetical protein